jgi:hypothetical protein
VDAGHRIVPDQSIVLEVVFENMVTEDMAEDMVAENKDMEPVELGAADMALAGADMGADTTPILVVRSLFPDWVAGHLPVDPY